MKTYERARFVAVLACLSVLSGVDRVEAQNAKQTPQNNVAAGGVTNSTVTTTTPSIPNSSNNYLDDKLFWSHYVTAFANTNDSAPVYCLPKFTRLMGLKSQFDTVTTSTPVAGGGSPTTQTKEYLEVQLDPAGAFFGLGKSQTAPPISWDAGKQSKCPTVPTGKEQIFYDGQVAYVDADDVKTAYRTGFDYGALLIPFKAQLSGKKSISGSAALGGYVGYLIPIPSSGIAFSPIIFAGASNISTSATSGGTTTSQTVAGLSYGFGLITTVKDSLQIGLVLGFDHVDSAQPYQYNDKPWLSFEVGYSFAQ